MRAQDYGFWLSALRLGLTFHNMQTPVISCFVGQTPKQDDLQEVFAIQIRNEIHRFAGSEIPKNLLETYNHFCKLRKVGEDDLNELLSHLYQQKWRAPFQFAKQAFAWHLRLYVKNYGLAENTRYENWIKKLEKITLVQKILG